MDTKHVYADGQWWQYRGTLRNPTFIIDPKGSRSHLPAEVLLREGSGSAGGIKGIWWELPFSLLVLLMLASWFLDTATRGIQALMGKPVSEISSAALFRPVTGWEWGFLVAVILAAIVFALCAIRGRNK